jgi:inorganic pyrophosphatase
MKIFIENEQGLPLKNIFDEVKLEYKNTHLTSAPYPYHYGFVLNTLSGDGDCLDCFVLTNQPLKTGQIIEVEPLALMEMKEEGEIDHKIIARMSDENFELTADIKAELESFIQDVFAHLGKKMEVGEFSPKLDAMAFLKTTRDNFKNRGTNG